MITDSNRIGDLAEHYAITYLWDNGYEVFRNCGCTGPIDMVAYKDGKTLLIDVKTMYADLRYPDSVTACSSRTALQKEIGVVILQFNPITRELRFTEHRNETTNTGYRDEQQPQLDLAVCDTGC